MEHYVTLFDSAFLPQGLALYDSLLSHAGSFKLWVLCMDAECKDVLDRLGLDHLQPVALKDIETEAILAIKPTRNRAEYCWTLTPFTPLMVFDREPSARRVTYLDADLWFLKNPTPIFREFEASGKSVMITEHAYAPEFDQSATSGRFCVQFMTFMRDSSEEVRSWWADRCLEWCFDRFENGKFGDQKYLDDWPERFEGSVHVLQRLDSLLAPWNASIYPYSRAIIYHFHGLRIFRKGVLLYRGYPIPHVTVRGIYYPYIQALNTVRQRLLAKGWQSRVQGKRPGLFRKMLSYVRYFYLARWRMQPIGYYRHDGV